MDSVKKYTIALIVAAAFSAGIAAEPQEGADLAALRTLAHRLLKRSDLGGAGAHGEVATASQAWSCSGPRRNEAVYDLSGQGILVSRIYRSFGEAGNPVGEYRAGPGKARWREWLTLIAAMRWKEEAGISRFRPPPGPTESIRTLSLSDGESSASFSVAGPAPASITEVLDFPGIHAMEAADTLWELSLAHASIKEGKGHLELEADWKYRGPLPVRIALPDSVDARGCGRAGFKWYADTSDFTVDWNYSEARKSADLPREWNPDSTRGAVLRLAFPFTAPGRKVPKVGQVNGLGVLVFLPGSAQPIPITLFSDTLHF
jgi:hypothetical protein